MPSMFEKITKKLVKELRDRQLRPVRCLVSATKIHRFSLIQRKKARSRFWQLPEEPLDVSLMHILEPGSSVPDVAGEESPVFTYTVVRKQQAAGSVNAGAEVGISGGMAVCQESSLQYRIVSTPHETWTELQKRKLPDSEPAFLKQCREAGVNLYVVTDTVELLNSPVLQDLSSKKISGKLSNPLDIWVKGKAEAEATEKREKQLTVPKGSVLAYRRKQLVFRSRGWDILYTADDGDRKTFPAGFRYMADDEEQGVPVCHMMPEMNFWILQEEVSQEVEAAKLSKDMQNVVFSNLLAMLRDREALQDLTDELEQEPCGHLDGPGGTILTELRKDSCYPEVGSKCLLLYLLEALMVLSDIQHDLLAQSMERRILLPQRDLVRSILEPNFNCFQNIPFTLQPELLAQLQEEGLAITYELLDECGLEMEPNSPRSTWDPKAKEPLSALYGALFLLNQLAEA
ncbi:gasdermin-C-like [Myotis daubentonii]|uniref:gasdermin-C-like n=1 Tax=Myotis daubentonii TaxID=98922 RepID=UPI002872C941|nr:gasdermin-C-like [Myotis daubentonii]